VRFVELLAALVLLFVIARVTIRAIAGAEQRRKLEGARWHVATHSRPGGGWEVVLECAGEPPQVVRELPSLEGDQLDELYEAQAEAEQQAAALNLSRRAPG
jgi:hypothetical protein